MRRAPLVQGVFYVVTGLWPVVHLRSFEAIAGRKRDAWLVRTTGALIAAIGTALLVGARERRATAPGSDAASAAPDSLQVLGIASAGMLLSADLAFVATGDIPRVYLADAVAEAALIGLWIMD